MRNLMTSQKIADISESVQQRFNENESVKSFSNFLEGVIKNPGKYCRNSAQYLKDVFDHFGYTEINDITGKSLKRWNLFTEFHPVFGQERAQNQLYNYISSFAENRVNKVILLHGPNGAAKTSLISSMIAAMEDYSKLPEGAVYSFNWIFSDTGEKETGFGFNKVGPSNLSFNKETLAFTKPEQITFKLACPMKDNPLFLIPKSERQSFLEFAYRNTNLPVPKHLLEGELCQKCKEIYDQLLLSYNADWSKIIRHIRVERFYFSKRFRKGITSIEQVNPDAHSRPLNIEQSYKIPPVLALSSMYEPYGDLVDANRGMVEFSEIFKRHVSENKYLLTTAEWGTISLPSFTAFLDCVIFATDNQKNLALFKHQSDWPSFNGRFAYVRVPYVLKWSDEKKSCEKIIENQVRAEVSPHTAEILSLWAILTRLRKSFNDAGSKLSLIEKAILYDKGNAPEHMEQNQKLTLLKELENIAIEFDNEHDRIIYAGNGRIIDASYEGRGGASYRELETIVISAITQNKAHISPVTLFRAIETAMQDNSLHEYLRLFEGNEEENSQFEKGFAKPEETIKQVKQYYVKLVKRDLRESSNLISDEEYSKVLERYIANVKAWSKNEKIYNPRTGSYTDPDQKLMDRIESQLGVEDVPEHRSALISKVANWALKNLDKIEEGKIPYENIFSDILEILKQKNNRDKKQQLDRLLSDILVFETEDWELVEKREDKAYQERVIHTIKNMIALGYSKTTLKEALAFLLSQENN